jgi:hypothetical protein
MAADSTNECNCIIDFDIHQMNWRAKDSIKSSLMHKDSIFVRFTTEKVILS